MPKAPKINSVNRIIDANINRAKEGLRVCEEIARFLLDDKALTSALKNKRHQLSGFFRQRPFALKDLIIDRKSLKDVGIAIYGNELKRSGSRDIFFANIQRVKESVRVLEEFSKLKDSRLAIKLKRIRYEIYDIEKKAFIKINK